MDINYIWIKQFKKKKKKNLGVPVVAQQKWTWLASMRMQVQSLDLLSVLRIWLCLELWCRLEMLLDLVLLWLWCRSVAVALIQPLAWEHPYAAGVALKTKTSKQTKLLVYGGLSLFHWLLPELHTDKLSFQLSSEQLLPALFLDSFFVEAPLFLHPTTSMLLVNQGYSFLDGFKFYTILPHPFILCFIETPFHRVVVIMLSM